MLQNRNKRRLAVPLAIASLTRVVSAQVECGPEVSCLQCCHQVAEYISTWACADMSHAEYNACYNHIFNACAEANHCTVSV
jgi:hypothetical protein